MAPKVKNKKQNAHSHDCHYQRSNNINKPKTFLTRMNYEKSLPFKKRLFLIEFNIKKQHFKPMPYEKPVTRSQQRRSSKLNANDKENHDDSFNDSKVKLCDKFTFENTYINI